MQKINWYLSVFDTNKLIGNKKQIRNNGIQKTTKIMHSDWSWPFYNLDIYVPVSQVILTPILARTIFMMLIEPVWQQEVFIFWLEEMSPRISVMSVSSIVFQCCSDVWCHLMEGLVINWSGQAPPLLNRKSQVGGKVCFSCVTMNFFQY